MKEHVRPLGRTRGNPLGLQGMFAGHSQLLFTYFINLAIGVTSIPALVKYLYKPHQPPLIYALYPVVMHFVTDAL